MVRDIPLDWEFCSVELVGQTVITFSTTLLYDNVTIRETAQLWVHKIQPQCHYYYHYYTAAASSWNNNKDKDNDNDNNNLTEKEYEIVEKYQDLRND